MPTEKDIKDPNTLWEYFIEYREEVNTTPRIVYEFHGKSGTERKKKLRVPLTIEGYKNFCRKKGTDINGYFYNVDGAYDEYLSIITRVKDVIRQDQIEGGMVGQYNSNLTARINNIKEQTENTNLNNIQILNIDPLDDSGDNKE